MTFAALLVTQKREKGKVSLCFFAGERCSPLQAKTRVQQTSRIKDFCPIRFFFCKIRRKRKSYQKENAEISFRALRSATDATVGSCKPLKRLERNFNGGRKL